MAIMTQGEISRFYREALTPILNKYRSIKIERIIKDAYLLPNGNIQESVDIVFEYTGNGELHNFPWHLPKITPNTKVCGVRIRVRENTKSYTISEEGELAIINIQLHGVKKGIIVQMKFEYYLLNVCEYKNGFLYNKVYYPMAFLAANGVKALDFRINFPAEAIVEHDSNFPKFISVDYDYNYNRKVLVTSKETILGDFSGYLTLKYKNDYFRPFWTFVLGVGLSASIGLIQLLNKWIGDWWYLGIPILLSVVS